MMKKFKKINSIDIVKILKCLFSTIILLSFSSPVWADIGNPIQALPEHSSQCIKIVRALERYHYLEKNLDNKMSSIIFDRYLKRLDPRKQLFTLQDINPLKQYQFRLDNELKKGNLNIAFKIFNLYIVRSKQRLEYISSMMKTWENDLDFNKNESVIIDNDLRQWKKNKHALYSLWKKEL
ncbi:MAG: tail-specific protease, partial [Desulfobacula sp.]|nr:tail-specific protease [Desulfobacula sp.]